MRSDLVALAAALGLALAPGCREPQAGGGEAVAERFQGVRRQQTAPAAGQSAFCERSYPAGGEGARRWIAPPERALPGAGEPQGVPGGPAWRWVNLWATWCAPCLEEMELLGRWRDGLSRDGMPVAFDLLSVDEAGREKDLLAWRAKGLPGRVRWLRSPEDLGPLLDSLGVERDAMIPVHALVDPAGWLRCVRVGAIHEQDYAAVRGLLGR
ncbi:MAG TPA: hypothetical protein VLS93_05040 [Anaeromyxobacteraceae bacterium]|nr:hypothetical protein [Anaeromyxobacteraceae bacterium]